MSDITVCALSWQKSSFSNEEGSCVELATTGEALALREGNDPVTVVTTTPPRLRALLRAVNAGRLAGVSRRPRRAGADQ